LNNKPKGKYYFLTTSSECYTVLYTSFCFAYSMLSVIDELCVRRFHFILLVIQFDTGKVLVMDSARKDPEMWADLKK